MPINAYNFITVRLRLAPITDIDAPSPKEHFACRHVEGEAVSEKLFTKNILFSSNRYKVFKIYE